MARIPGFHPGGPGSIPGMGDSFFTPVNKKSFSMERRTQEETDGLFAPQLIINFNTTFS